MKLEFGVVTKGASPELISCPAQAGISFFNILWIED